MIIVVVRLFNTVTISASYVNCNTFYCKNLSPNLLCKYHIGFTYFSDPEDEDEDVNDKFPDVSSTFKPSGGKKHPSARFVLLVTQWDRLSPFKI